MDKNLNQNSPGESEKIVGLPIKIGGGRYGTRILDVDTLNDLCLDFVSGIKIGKLTKKYSIGYDRILKVLNNESSRIDKIRAETALKCEKEFAPKAIAKRTEILDNISEKDIKNAKLNAKTSSIHDLTTDIRLSMGLSTDNIAIISKQLNEEQLLDYVLTGNLQVNNNIEKNDLNVSNGQTGQIDVKE